MVDREPQPSDGPEYHADHAAWARRENWSPSGPRSIESELTALAAQLDRVKAEEQRLYAARLAKWTEARAAGLSWRAIAAASGGMDHAQIAKTVSARAKGTD